MTNPNTGWTTTGSVSANGMHTFFIPDVQAYSFGSEIVEQKGLKVISTDTISLFIANEATNSFDASIVLPAPVLGSKYLVQTYTPSTSSVVCSDNNGSVFLIVATEDNTIIDITPAVTTMNGRPAGIPFTIVLNAGDSYQVVSLSQNGNSGDLTGTKVEARDCKKIALFNGNVLTGIPVNMSSGYDHIFEQAIPLTYWGQQFIVTSSLTRSGDMIRVMAAQDGTTVRKNGLVIARLNAGASTEFFLSSSESVCIIETSLPSAVHLFQTTSDYDYVINGDPSMVWITPIEQQIKEIVFGTFNAQNIGNHYVNIVAPTAAISSMRLDNAYIGGQFTPLTASPDYSYAKIVVSPGVHHLQSDAGFTAHVYGFGYAQGYAYSVGSMAIELDRDISLNGIPANLIPEDRYYCFGDSLHFGIIVNYDIESSVWDFGDGSDTIMKTEPSHLYSQPGNYTATAIIRRTYVDCLGSLQDTITCTIRIHDLRDTIVETVCIGENYSLHGFAIPAHAAPGTYQYEKIIPSLLCDSTVVLQLQVRAAYEKELYDNACVGTNYTSHGFSIPAHTSSGSYRYQKNLISSAGCGSIVVLYLEVSDVSVTITSSTSDLCEEPYAVLTADASNSNFLWNTGEITPSITVEAPGAYSASVSEGDCEKKDIIILEGCPFTPYLPNAISPGRPEGLNDQFYLINTDHITEL